MTMYHYVKGKDELLTLLQTGTRIGPPALVLADRFLDAALEAGATPAQGISTWRAVWYLVSSELTFEDATARREPGQESW